MFRRSPRSIPSPRRAMHVLALVAVLLPLQGLGQGASSSPAPVTRSAKSSKVFVALKKQKVTTHQHARVKVVVAPGGSRARGKALGRVKVVVKGGGQKRAVGATMTDHRKVVTLPKLPKGTYRIHAKFLGNATLAQSRSRSKSLKVVAPGGGPSGFPGEGNTGVPAGTKLTAYSGPTNITTAGTVITGKNIGCIQVSAPGVVIRNSRLSCGNATPYVVTVDDGDLSGTPLLLQDVEIDCQDTSGTAVGEAMVTVQRADIHGCENGFDANQSITVEDSYIHDLYNTAESHTDGIQLGGGHWNGSGFVPGGLNITIRHNTIYGVGADGSLGTSAIISNPKGDQNILIKDNLLAGGAYTLYCDYSSTASNYQVIGNHFSRKFSGKVGAYGPSEGCGDETQSGNVYHESGAPLRLG